MHITTLCLGAAVLLAPAAAAQDVTVERDGDEVTITRPDGTTERFTIDEDAELRVRSKDGPLVIEREDGDGEHRAHRFELRDGDDPSVWFRGPDDEDGPRSFAFRMRPGEGPFRFEDFDLEDLDFKMESDSALERALRFRLDAERFGGEHFLPWPGFGQRGVDSATRRGIAEGERESRRLAEGERESRRLARQLRRAEGAERDRLARELRETLERAFDLKQQARRERIEALREDAERIRENLTELEEELAEREAVRGEILERRQQELLGESDELDW